MSRRGKARQARTTRIVGDAPARLPITADGELYATARRYTVDGREVVVAWVNPARKGSEPTAVVRNLDGRPLQTVLTTQLVPLDPTALPPRRHQNG